MNYLIFLLKQNSCFADPFILTIHATGCIIRTFHRLQHQFTEKSYNLNVFSWNLFQAEGYDILALSSNCSNFSMDLLNFHKKSICLFFVRKIKLFLALLLIVKTGSGGSFSACQLCIYWAMFKFLNFRLFPSNSARDLQLCFRLETTYLYKINDYIDFSMAEISLL